MKLGPEYNLPYGTLVVVSVPEFTFEGKIVGKASTDLTQSHIVTCTDGTIPNKDYLYDTMVASIPLIEIKE